MEFRKRIIASYPVLFGEANDEGQDLNNEYSEQAQFAKHWGWYSSLYALAGGDFTKFDRVTELGLTSCLTYLTFEKQKNEIEQRQLNKLRK